MATPAAFAHVWTSGLRPNPRPPAPFVQVVGRLALLHAKNKVHRAAMVRGSRRLKQRQPHGPGTAGRLHVQVLCTNRLSHWNTCQFPAVVCSTPSLWLGCTGGGGIAAGAGGLAGPARHLPAPGRRRVPCCCSNLHACSRCCLCRLCVECWDERCRFWARAVASHLR